MTPPRIHDHRFSTADFAGARSNSRKRCWLQQLTLPQQERDWRGVFGCHCTRRNLEAAEPETRLPKQQLRLLEIDYLLTLATPEAHTKSWTNCSRLPKPIFARRPRSACPAVESVSRTRRPVESARRTMDEYVRLESSSTQTSFDSVQSFFYRVGDIRSGREGFEPGQPRNWKGKSEDAKLQLMETRVAMLIATDRLDEAEHLCKQGNRRTSAQEVAFIDTALDVALLKQDFRLGWEPC